MSGTKDFGIGNSPPAPLQPVVRQKVNMLDSAVQIGGGQFVRAAEEMALKGKQTMAQVIDNSDEEEIQKTFRPFIPREQWKGGRLGQVLSLIDTAPLNIREALCLLVEEIEEIESGKTRWA